MSHPLDDLRQDLVYGVRSLRRNPGFAALAVLTMAIGIGANSAIFSALDATLLRPLPFEEPDRLMKVALRMPRDGGRIDMTWSYPKFLAFAREQTPFETMALYIHQSVTIGGAEGGERVSGESVSAHYLETLGIRPLHGSGLAWDDDGAPPPPSVLLGEGYWRRRFGGDPRIVGTQLEVDGSALTVAGILPPGFRGLTGRADLWMPIPTMRASSMTQAGAHQYEMVARLRSGATPAQAKAVATAMGHRLAEIYPGSGEPWGAIAYELSEVRLDPGIKRAVLVAAGAAAFLLLIACANLAGLLLARGAARHGEIAIRMAIGAQRGRLVRQMLAESTLLTVLGGVASVSVAWIGVRLLASIAPTGSGDFAGAFAEDVSGLTTIGLRSMRIDLRMLGMTALAATVAGVLCGLLPALRGSRVDLTDALKTAGKQRPGFAGIRRLTPRGALVVVELALAVVLLVGCGLMVRSLDRLLDAPMGFDASGVMTSRVSISSTRAGGATVESLWAEMLDRLAQLPGVESVGVATCAPLSTECEGTSIGVGLTDQVPIGLHGASPGYFDALHIPVIAGRDFTAADHGGAPRVVIVNRAAVNAYWGGTMPVGQRVLLWGDTAEVIGVVGDVAYERPEDRIRPSVYVPFAQRPFSSAVIFVRTAADPGSLVGVLRREVARLDPAHAVYDVKPMAARMGDATARTRFITLVLGAFSGVALLLAAIGIYGVMALAVVQRRREIGIRMALGAPGGRVVAMLLREGMVLAALGAFAGVGLAAILTQVLGALLYGIQATDVPAYGASLAVLGLVAFTAAYLPARRVGGMNLVQVVKTEE